MTDSTTPISNTAENNNATYIAPCQGPADKWTDMEKLFFKIMLSEAGRELMAAGYNEDVIVFHERPKKHTNILMRYDEARLKEMQDFLLHHLAAGGDPATVVLLGGESEKAAAFFELPDSGKVRRKLQFIHIDDNQKRHIIRGKDGGLAAAEARNLNLPPPTLAQITAYQHRLFVAKVRFFEECRAVALFQNRLASVTPWGTYAILAILAIYAALTMFLGGFDNTPTLVRLGALVPDKVRAGEWWRLVTCGFLHGGFIHLLVNSYAFFILGGFLERLLGNWRFLVLYFTSLLAGALSSTFFMDGGLSVGASGAIWGLMAAEAVLIFLPRGLLPEMVTDNAKRSVIYCLAINLLISFTPSIDMSAHLGGGFAGAILMASGLLTYGLPQIGQRATPHMQFSARLYQILGAIVTALAAATLLIALQEGRPFSLHELPKLVKTEAFGAELQYPAYPGKKPILEADNALNSGDLRQDPAVFSLTVSDLPAGGKTEIDAYMQTLLSEIMRNSKGDKDFPKPHVRSINGPKQIIELTFKGRYTIKRYFWPACGHLWRLDMMVWPIYEQDFRGLPERIINATCK